MVEVMPFDPSREDPRQGKMRHAIIVEVMPFDPAGKIRRGAY
jgi:hypothetical protein